MIQGQVTKFPSGARPTHPARRLPRGPSQTWGGFQLEAGYLARPQAQASGCPTCRRYRPDDAARLFIDGDFELRRPPGAAPLGAAPHLSSPGPVPPAARPTGGWPRRAPLRLRSRRRAASARRGPGRRPRDAALRGGGSRSSRGREPRAHGRTRAAGHRRRREAVPARAQRRHGTAGSAEPLPGGGDLLEVDTGPP